MAWTGALQTTRFASIDLIQAINNRVRSIGVLDAKGNLYVAAGLTDHQPAQTLLLTKMSDQVTVTGTVVKKGGLQMIYIDSVK